MYFYETDKNLKIYLHYLYFHTKKYCYSVTHYYSRSYIAYMKTVVMNGQNELVYSSVFLGHTCFFPCCSSAAHRRYMKSAISERSKLSSIHSINECLFRTKNVLFMGLNFGYHRNE